MRPLPLAVAYLLVGSITVAHEGTPSRLDVLDVEARLAPLAPGSSAGPSGTEGAATVLGALVSTTTDSLHLNNTNATGAWHARLELVDATGVANLALLSVGLDNGTRTDQVQATLGTLTLTEGAWVELAPASAGRIYVTQAVTTLGLDSTLRMRLVASDVPGGSGYVVSTVNVTID